MKLNISQSKTELGKRAAIDGAELIRRTLSERGEANIIVDTVASQFEMLAEDVKAEGIALHNVPAVHLCEYVYLMMTHPTLLRTYLGERFVSILPLPPPA